jgi:hypothetical protein
VLKKYDVEKASRSCGAFFSLSSTPSERNFQRLSLGNQGSPDKQQQRVSMIIFVFAPQIKVCEA